MPELGDAVSEEPRQRTFDVALLSRWLLVLAIGGAIGAYVILNRVAILPPFGDVVRSLLR